MITFTQWGKMGRLGNQILQAATVIGLARKNNDEFILPPWSEESRFNLHGCYGNVQPTMTYTEKHFQYQEFPSNTNDKIVDLVGYYQSWKYFEHCKDEIIKIFTPKGNYTKKNGVTGIHVRRGDYVNVQHYHPCLSKNYYLEAMKVTKSPRYMVFSDDIAYCKDMFADRNDIIYSEGKDAIDDLLLLSLCDNQIIANSSFSWVAAYLNTNPNKIVVAPNKWFGPAMHHNTKDLLPIDWAVVDINGSSK